MFSECTNKNSIRSKLFYVKKGKEQKLLLDGVADTSIGISLILPHSIAPVDQSTDRIFCVMVTQGHNQQTLANPHFSGNSY
jgi:hypothetical protein